MLPQNHILITKLSHLFSFSFWNEAADEIDAEIFCVRLRRCGDVSGFSSSEIRSMLLGRENALVDWRRRTEKKDFLNFTLALFLVDRVVRDKNKDDLLPQSDGEKRFRKTNRKNFSPLRMRKSLLFSPSLEILQEF